MIDQTTSYDKNFESPVDFYWALRSLIEDLDAAGKDVRCITPYRNKVVVAHDWGYLIFASDNPRLVEAVGADAHNVIGRWWFGPDHIPC